MSNNLARTRGPRRQLMGYCGFFMLSSLFFMLSSFFVLVFFDAVLLLAVLLFDAEAVFFVESLFMVSSFFVVSWAKAVIEARRHVSVRMLKIFFMVSRFSLGEVSALHWQAGLSARSRT